MKPFAIELYERMLVGKSAGDLSLEMGIPLWRLDQRIRAAAAYLRRRRGEGGAFRPVALQIYEEHQAGKSAAQISAELQIPVGRVAARIRAAEAYHARHRLPRFWVN